MILSLYLIWLLFASTIAVERRFYHSNQAEEYFEEFIILHGKNYSPLEKQKRFKIFKDNLEVINHLNSFNESVHGINQFTDLSQEEFSEQYNSCVGPDSLEQSKCRIISDAQIVTNQAPATLDYRQQNAVTSVKDQRQCNICWAFASVGSLEGAYALKHGQLLSFSPQQLMDCLKCSGHCRYGGYMTSAFSELIGTPGVMLESDYPYVARDLICQFQPAKAKVQVTGCLNFALRDENKLKEALAIYGPIAIAINSTPIQSYQGGIVTAQICPPSQPGHAVLLVGYGTEGGKDYWLIKNSWGSRWGPEGGYFRLARGQNVCGMINNFAASATIT